MLYDWAEMFPCKKCNHEIAERAGYWARGPEVKILVFCLACTASWCLLARIKPVVGERTVIPVNISLLCSGTLDVGNTGIQLTGRRCALNDTDELLLLT